MPEDFPPQPPPPFASATPGPASPPPPPYAQQAAYAGYPPGYAYAASPYAGYGYPPSPPPRSGWFWAAIIVGILAVVFVIFCVIVSSLAKNVSGSADTGTFGQDSI